MVMMMVIIMALNDSHLVFDRAAAAKVMDDFASCYLIIFKQDFIGNPD